MSKSGVDFAKLVGTTEEAENDENPEKFKRQVSSRDSIRSSSASLSSIGVGSEFDEDEEELDGVEMEASSKGKVKGSVAAAYFKAGTHWSLLFVLALSFLIVQLLASAADYWVSVW